MSALQSADLCLNLINVYSVVLYESSIGLEQWRIQNFIMGADGRGRPGSHLGLSL